MKAFKHMKGIIFFVLILTTEIVAGQKMSGIFLPLDVELANCNNKYKLLNKPTEHCLSNAPAIKMEEFAGVSEIYFHPTQKRRLIDIHLTPKGSQMLKTIITKLEYEEIAVVVNGRLVSIMKVNGSHSTKSISIWDQFDTKALEWVQKSLAKQLPKPGQDLKFNP